MRMAILLASTALAATAQTQMEQKHGTPPKSKPLEQSKPMDHMQMPGMDHSQMPGMAHGGMEMNRAGEFLMNQASGTSMNPQSWTMPMLMTHAGSWHVMFMGTAFLVDTQQSTARGGDKFYSANTLMTAVEHKAGSGSFRAELMLSLEP